MLHAFVALAWMIQQPPTPAPAPKPAQAQPLAPLTAGERLWPPSATSPYDAPPAKKYNKHDLVKITVVERASGSVNGSLTTDRRSRWETQIKDFMRITHPKGGDFPFQLSEALGDEDPKINIDSRYRQDHLGRTNRQFDLTFTIMAEVADVRPNGNLVLEAKKERTINSEVESIKVTGETSPQFIADGAVKSENIMNLRLSYSGDGGVSDVAEPGLIGMLLNKFWPF